MLALISWESFDKGPPTAVPSFASCRKGAAGTSGTQRGRSTQHSIGWSRPRSSRAGGRTFAGVHSREWLPGLDCRPAVLARTLCLP